MSQAQLVRPRFGGGRQGYKKYRFSPGRLERLELSVWRIPKSEGVIKARLTGKAYVACGAGNEHYPKVEIVSVGHPRNDDMATMVGALAGDELAATDLAEELEQAALEDWFDPCEDELTDIYGGELG